MLTAKQVADYFLRAVDETAGDGISNLRLQKLLYYAQAWHLANFDTPLFEEDFEAWMYGPVIPSLFRMYKDSGTVPLPRPRGSAPVIDDVTRTLLDEIWDVYGAYSATQLMRFTHEEIPWIDARGDVDAGAPCTNIIPKAVMRDFFRARLDEIA
jgi:uncharacterized phage-associated protein